MSTKKTHNFGPIENSKLNCLVLWPPNTVGHQRELELINTLNELCKKFGYGRVPQLAAAIEEIWRNPEAVKSHEKTQKHYLEMHAKAQKQFSKEFIEANNESQGD